MKRILSSIDIGSSSIKFIVAEIINDKVNILSSISLESRGVKNGLIVSPEDLIFSIKKVLKKSEDILGIKIKKTILSIPEYDLKFLTGSGVNTINSEDGIVSKNDVSRILKTCAYNKVSDDYELINIIPLEYKLDQNIVDNPIGLSGNKLELNSIIICAPKDYTYSYINVLEKCGLEVIDIVFGSSADYSMFKSEFTDNSNGIIVNIGADITKISLFYKGIFVNNKIFNFGGNVIDDDITFMYKTKEEDSKKIKERYSLAGCKYASTKEITSVINKLGEKIEINQYELSEIVGNRLDDVLKKIKNIINHLTKKEISYIIVTGGLTELKDFNILLCDIFGSNSSLGKVSVIGARDNKYATSIGMIKNFNEKLNKKGKEYSILDSDQLDSLCSSSKEINVVSDSLLGKVFGYFFDN